MGYLAAYSGQIGGRSDWEDFVPAVFDYLQPDGYFKTHEAEISGINQSISHLEKDEQDEGSQNPDPATAGGAEADHRCLSGEDEGGEGKA